MFSDMAAALLMSLGADCRRQSTRFGAAGD
jgi:hypothetical protein